MSKKDRGISRGIVLTDAGRAYLHPGQTVKVVWVGDPLCCCGARGGSAHVHGGKAA